MAGAASNPGREEAVVAAEEEEEAGGVVGLPHPLGVRPYGAQLELAARNLRDLGGLGKLCCLSDELILRTLAEVGPRGLATCARCSHALRIFCYSEDIWRGLVLEELPASEPLQVGSAGWRCTYIKLLAKRVPPGEAGVSVRSEAGRAILYSDALFAPWHCGTASIPSEWTHFENILRVSASSLTVSEFEERFEKAGRPVILTGVVSSWPAFHHWEEERLRSRFGHLQFHVSGHSMALSDFFDYSRSTTDETPLYLFDKGFAQVAPELASEYSVPNFFDTRRDLFAQLPDAFRPDHRWLIIGGARSGSLWHVDPNSTSAWNAVVRGKKKWILCPPHAPPPGVTASRDGATVTTPLSLYEWFRVFYSSLAEQRGKRTGPLEAVVEEGELLFIPRDWWHTALNCAPSIAITQNYVPPCTADHVYRFLRTPDAAALVSGVPLELRASLHEHFAEVMRRHCLATGAKACCEYTGVNPTEPGSRGSRLWKVITQDGGASRKTSTLLPGTPIPATALVEEGEGDRHGSSATEGHVVSFAFDFR